MSLPARISTILFDLDDTLLDSFRARVRALDTVFRDAGIRDLTGEAFIRSQHGRQLQRSVADMTGSEERGWELLEAYRRAYWRKPPGLVRALPGVESMVRRLLARGARLGIVTQKERLFELDGLMVGAASEVEEIGWGDVFHVLVGFEDVANHKPHPEGVHRALAALGAAPEDTLFVGDSAADMEAGLAAGCWSCHAVWGGLGHEAPLDGLTPHVVARWPEEVLALVQA